VRSPGLLSLSWHPTTFGKKPDRSLVPQSVTRWRWVMSSEVVQGCPAGPPYRHALSLALAAYLGRKFSAAPNKRDADHAADAPTRGQ
jgi:hypothetical protein